MAREPQETAPPASGFKVCRRSGRKRALGSRTSKTRPSAPNQARSLDFVSVVLANGQRFRVLCVIDDITWECLALAVDSSLTEQMVARELDAMCARR